MNKLQVVTIQYDIKSNLPKENRETIEKLVLKSLAKAKSSEEESEEATRLVVLPEMMTCGFSIDSHLCAEQENDSETTEFLKHLSTENNIFICGSLPIKDSEERIFNRLLFVSPNGKIDHYDKKHLFSIGFEREAYTEGKEMKIVDCEGWKIMLSVCYDVRFPVWLRNVDLKYDVLLNVANWPTSRIEGWQTLLKARAIENQAYVAGVNRCGTDSFDIEYSGKSQVIDFKGNIVSKNRSGNSFALSLLDYEALRKFRKKFTTWQDADVFEIK